MAMVCRHYEAISIAVVILFFFYVITGGQRPRGDLTKRANFLQKVRRVHQVKNNLKMLFLTPMAMICSSADERASDV